MQKTPLLLLLAGIIIFLGAPLIGFVLSTWDEWVTVNLMMYKVSDPQVAAQHMGQALLERDTGMIVGATFGLPLIILALTLHFIEKPR